MSHVDIKTKRYVTTASLLPNLRAQDRAYNTGLIFKLKLKATLDLAVNGWLC